MQVKNESILDCLKNNGKTFGLLSAIGGFIGDVLQPLAPFSEYIFYILLIGMIPLLLIYFFSKNLKNRVTPLLSFSIIFAFISGGLFGLQLASNNNDKGVLSAVVPGIEKVQISLGIIDKKLISIKEDTEEIKKSTKNISGKLDTLTQNIGKQGGIILNPSTSEEWYSNARLYELKGDYFNARRSYIKYFSFNGEYLDPHIRFQRFLKIQEGLEGAREVYNSLFEEDKNIVVVYAKLLLSPSKFKQNNIASFIKLHPKFAPAYYELAQQNSEAILGGQTLTEKRLEYENYEQFIALNEKGLLGRYYLDKDKMLEMLEIAKSKMDAVHATNSNIFNQPLSFKLFSAPGGEKKWTLSLWTDDFFIDLYYQLEGEANFTAFRKYNWNSSDTGKPQVRTEMPIELPHMNPQIIKAKYRDSRGILRGPYEFKFDPKNPPKLY